MKLIYPLFLFFLLNSLSVKAQFTFEEELLEPIPFKTTNAAIAEGFVDEKPYVYVFGGLDTTKNLYGIHQKSWRYNVQAKLWEPLDDLPDTLGKIAMAASRIKHKIYIMGGYHVTDFNSEKSSDRVHVFNTQTNQFEQDGSPIPKPIDDQVQVVWRDSLIYLISGWSNTGNVSHVQVYDPAFDSWLLATPVPSNTNYRAFGASGCIIGDTIYYYGGAQSGTNFPGTPYLRKGVINPLDPLAITWSIETDCPQGVSYRSASFKNDYWAFWFGGSSVTYNYDGIAYNGSGGVDPRAQIQVYDTYTKAWMPAVNTTHGIMDLRGIAQISDNEWISVGGLDSSQNVTNYVLRLKLVEKPLQFNQPDPAPKAILYPNPTSGTIHLELPENAKLITINDSSGRLIKQIQRNESDDYDLRELAPGTYTIFIENEYFNSLIIE